MAYDPEWYYGDINGQLGAGMDTVHLADAQEIADAVNRRRLLTYQSSHDFSSHLYSGAPVRQSTLDFADPPPFQDFRHALVAGVLVPPTGSMGGQPPSPSSMKWLWPVDDGDEDKILVSGLAPPDPGEVGLLDKINGTDHWTDHNLLAGVTGIRAVHLNELRQAVEHVRRGRWEMPIYWTSGLTSVTPDTPWDEGWVSYTSSSELRSVGYAVFRGGTPLRGLANVTVRPSSYVEVTADIDCTVEVYHCLRPMDHENWPATWNEYNPGTSSAWATPGGTGQGDSVSLGSVALTANTPGQISGTNLVSGFQNIVDGAEQNFLIRRVDMGDDLAAVDARVVIEFDLNTPPN